MATKVPTREEALSLFKTYNSSESLLKHALSVEAVMRYIAEKLGEDKDEWGIIGLVHDIDYEKYPNEHCIKSTKILTENSWPKGYIRAVASHGWGICTDIKPETVHTLDVGFKQSELNALQAQNQAKKDALKVEKPKPKTPKPKKPKKKGG